MSEPVAEVPHLPIEEFRVDKCKELSALQNEKFEEKNFDSEKAVNYNEQCSGNFSRDTLMIIQGMGMDKYLDLFQKEQISTEILFGLEEVDLEVIGVDNLDDRKKILSELQELRRGKYKGKNLSENKDITIHYKDLAIACNVLKHLVLLENYAAFTSLKVKKEEHKDYFVSKDKTAVEMFKLVTEKSIQQTNKILSLVYESDSNLIDNILKKQQLTLPSHHAKNLKNKEKKEKVKKRKRLLKILTCVGLTSLGVLVLRMFIRPINSFIHQCSIKYR